VRAALKHAIRCGVLLEEQKAVVPHGEWLAWLNENFDGSARVAQTYMRLSRNRQQVEELAKAQTSAHLSIGGALRALASPREPAALEAPDEADAGEEDRDAFLEHCKREAREHAERADAEWANAQKQYDATLMHCSKFVELHDAIPDDLLNPEDRARVEKMRAEVDDLARRVQENMDAGRELFGEMFVPPAG
jgi:Mg2+ and Co2+ transporter CorA